MPRTLRTNSLPGILDRVHERGRARLSEQRADEDRQYTMRERARKEELGVLEHEDKVGAIREERGAREAARLPLSGATAPTPEGQPEQLGGPGMEEGEAGASGEQTAAPAAPPPALWLRTAKAQSDYWRKQGRPERASKTLIDAYKGAFNEEEARFQHEIQPQQENVRRLNLTAEELKADATAVQLQQASEMNQMHAAGKLWGLVKMGATQDALNLFNSSNVLQPGVKAESIRVVKLQVEGSAPIDAMVLLDAEGKPLKNKKGQDMIYPVMLLERMHQQATTSTMNLKSGESIVQVRKDPVTGTTSVAPLHTAANPTEQNTQANRLRQKLNDGRAALKDRLFAGQTMMDKVDPRKQKIHERAQPLVEQYINAGSDPSAAVDRAVKEAEDAIKREGAGAGPKGDGAPKPTVKDIIDG